MTLTSSAPAVADSPAATAVPPGIELREVSKQFAYRGGQLLALDGVSLSAARHSFVSLIGPSGCGKSTVLRLLAGLETATSGEVLIDGAPVTRDRRRQPLGIAFQDAALLPWRTVRQNIALPGEVIGTKSSPAQIDALIELVGLQAFADAKPRQLSGGMRQRVAIARALVTEPEVLLLDEPFGALDDLTRRTLNLELLGVLERKPATTLMVTHAIDEAILLSDTVVVMTPRPGRVLAVIDIDLPRPRGLEVLASERFRALEAEALRLLYGGMEQA
ncbi:MAG: ABC transporter ATP-binding protein [Bifidobacteriaceae bacterium]|jgi:NitT/TauT family transport system ATP-binding protein|nr:ABC transporter ATP-binding protein [Bifidobacteriaceae bacterium]